MAKALRQHIAARRIRRTRRPAFRAVNRMRGKPCAGLWNPYWPRGSSRWSSKAIKHAGGKEVDLEMGMEIWDPSMMEGGAGAAWGFWARRPTPRGRNREAWDDPGPFFFVRLG